LLAQGTPAELSASASLPFSGHRGCSEA